ncbi:hypothetical protein A0U94_05955 [Gluconobacter albidus]|nr:hypothetical protein A0U94_05955 [Gluconobacter albidus]
MQNVRTLLFGRPVSGARQDTPDMLLMGALLFVGAALVIVGVRVWFQAVDWLCENDVFPPMIIMLLVATITMMLFNP